MNQSVQERRLKVERENTSLSVTRQCSLLNIHRSGLYYKPVGESQYNLELMRMIDEQHMKRPWYGVPRMTTWPCEDMGHMVNHKRMERLYRLLGISAVGPKPNTSKPGRNHNIYPYLLKTLKIKHPNQVWAIDIIYISVQGGYLYLVVIIDLYSRHVVNWSLSNTMSSHWCTETLKEAVRVHGKPEIINTDQGSQFTATEFSEYVTDKLDIKLSMDGKGRSIDNIFIERLWRSLKYEHVYLFPACGGVEAYQGLEQYFSYYNTQRRPPEHRT